MRRPVTYCGIAVTLALGTAAAAPTAVHPMPAQAATSTSTSRSVQTSAPTAQTADRHRLTDTRLNGVDIDRATIPQLHRLMRRGTLSSRALTRFYLARVRRVDPLLRSVLQVNPDALREAAASDARQRNGQRPGRWRASRCC